VELNFPQTAPPPEIAYRESQGMAMIDEVREDLGCNHWCKKLLFTCGN